MYQSLYTSVAVTANKKHVSHHTEATAHKCTGHHAEEYKSAEKTDNAAMHPEGKQTTHRQRQYKDS